MIKLKLSGAKEFSDFIKSIPRGMKIVAMRAIADHFVGSETSGLRREPPYKYFSFKSVYGGFFSEAQRGYVMAAIKSGKITPGQPNRTHAIRDEWKTNETGDWRRVNITNDAPGVDWVKGDQQARMMSSIGWTPATKDVEGGMANAMREAQAAVDEALLKKSMGGSSESVGL